MNLTSRILPAPPIVLVILLFAITGPASSSAGIDIDSNAENLPHTESPIMLGFEVLWDQTGNPASGCSPSQNFTDLGAMVQAADDFTVSDETGWSIEIVYLDGVYNAGSGPADSWNVFIYQDSPWGPGELLFSDLSLDAMSDTGGNVTLELSEPAVLPAGTYWISVTADLEFGPGNQQFFWCRRTVQNIDPFHWLDISDLFGLGCQGWAPGSVCLGALDPDLLYSLGGRVNTVVFEVNTIQDTGDSTPGDGSCEDGGGDCSLRAAIEEANALSGEDTILLPAGVYPLELGQLDVTDDLNLTGAGPEVTAIDGQNFTRLFMVGDGAEMWFQISNLTLQNANLPTPSGAAVINFGHYADGILDNIRVVNNTGWSNAGVLNSNIGSTIVIRDSLFQGNVAQGGVLGLYNAEIVNTRVISNTATGIDISGGTINLQSGSITNSEIVGNYTTGNGGGINGDGKIGIFNTLIAGNYSERRGGGIQYIGGPLLTIINSTIAGNFAEMDGGGIKFSASANNFLEIVNTTIYGNIADYNQDGFGDGGGIIYEASSFESVFLRNSILFGNIDTGGEAPDCEGKIVSEDFNFVGSLAGCDLVGDLINTLIGVDPLLLPLADNGGPTHTMALQSNSPAIGAGSCFSSDGNLVIFDQRGFFRPAADCDVGAFELDPGFPALLPLIFRHSPISTEPDY